MEEKNNWYYDVYLKSEFWKKLRNEVIQKYDNKCALCGSGINLNIHHLHYRNYDRTLEDGGKLDEEYNLICLCEKCHFNFHKIKAEEENKIKDWQNKYEKELENLIDFEKPVYELFDIEAEQIIKAIGPNKTKHFSKLQSYFSVTPEPLVLEVIKKSLMKTRKKQGSKKLMQIVKEKKLCKLGDKNNDGDNEKQ